MERLIRVSKQKVSLLLDNLKVIWYKKVDTSNSRKRSKITGVRKVHKMAREQRKYEKGYKVQAVKLAKEIGAGKAAKVLGALRKQIKTLDRENRHLKEENEFLRRPALFSPRAVGSQ